MNSASISNGSNGTTRRSTADGYQPTAAPQSTGQIGKAQYSEQSYSFRRATKKDAKLRMAIAGPSGSGKTYSLLKIATELGGPIAVVDTERGSAEKYADLFEFDTLPLSSFSPDLIPQLIEQAAREGYRVLIIDSLSHFWNGTDGELDQVERVKMRMRDNGWAAWREITPKHNRLIDAMLGAPIHVLVSMRVKTEWIVETDDKGKTKPRKVGLQPVMRDGIEYEFDVCGDIDQEHNFVITKSRCPELADQVFNKPGTAVAGMLKSWLSSPKTTAEQKRVAEKRIEDLRAPEAPVHQQPEPETPRKTPSSAVAFDPLNPRPFKNAEERASVFERLREKVGDVRYFAELDAHNVPNPAAFKSYSAQMAFYRTLATIALAEREAA